MHWRKRSSIWKKNSCRDEEYTKEGEKEEERLSEAYRSILEMNKEHDWEYARKVDLEKDLEKEKSGAETIQKELQTLQADLTQS